MLGAGKHRSILASTIITAVSFAGLAFVFFKYKSKFSFSFFRRNPLRNQKIEVINTQQECRDAIFKIRKACSTYRVLGFDCEWVTRGSSRQPVALLQLASADGFCALIRLCKFKDIPNELKDILEDISVLKVGVAPIEDAKLLRDDYSLNVHGVLDLRYLAVEAKERPEGLSHMALRHLNFRMEKNWRIRCSDWEAETLSTKQLNYAASDAHVGVELFKIFTDRIVQNEGKSDKTVETEHWKFLESLCSKHLDHKYKAKGLDGISKKEAKRVATAQTKKLLRDEKRQSQSPHFKPLTRNYPCPTRKKVYTNCFMEAADGELLCTCDRKKAEWYVSKEIADVVTMEPYTIRLRFEPAGRSVGDVGRFYQCPRLNSCVVCGAKNSNIRKNVVPREYRKLFPAVMKDHSSHDVLLLCIRCHQVSSNHDQVHRIELAEVCNAPIDNKTEPKLVKDLRLQKVRSHANCLMSSKHVIPAERRAELAREILEYYPHADELTDELLEAASKLT